MSSAPNVNARFPGRSGSDVVRWLDPRAPEGCGAITTLSRNRAVDAVRGREFALIGARPDRRFGFRFWLGAQIGDTKCLPLPVPELRASIGKQAILTRRWSRRLFRGAPFGCLPSFSRPLRLRPARSPLLSAKDRLFLLRAGKPRWNASERHRSQRASAQRSCRPRSRRTTMQPGHGLPRRELRASTPREREPRAAKSSIRTN